VSLWSIMPAASRHRLISQEEAEEWLALSCPINSPKAGSDSQPANWWMRLAEHSISKNSHHAGRKKRGKSD
jgi:hypothetical protein